jgi:hypothetical protein
MSQMNKGAANRSPLIFFIEMWFFVELGQKTSSIKNKMKIDTIKHEGYDSK